jgi:hypothetical protein
VLWLNPSALFALVAVAAPILIHILIQRRAERFPFPTLRFLQPTRLAAIRRHVLEDIVLLAVRIALLAAAVAALAGPLLVTAARRQAWDRRVVRAVVVDDVVGNDVARGFQSRARSPERAAPHQEKTFEAASLPDGMRRAILWLDTAPPARRELVVASGFPIGSITDADLSAIPSDIGVRLERTGALPDTRTVAAGRLLTSGGVREREVTLAGDQTSVRDTAVREPLVWPIDVVSSKAEQPIIDAAVAAVLSQRVWAAPPDRRARLVLVEQRPAAVPEPPMTDVAQPGQDVAQSGPDAVRPGEDAVRPGPDAVRPGQEVAQAFRPAIVDGLSNLSALHQPWMADAAARIARDLDLRAAAARVTAGLSDARFAAAPWQALAFAADGRPFAVAAASANRLVVASAARATDVAAPLLLRAMANAIAVVPDLQRAEVVPIADARLRQWSRPAAPASPRIETVDQDDRRWLWLAALCLLGLEQWIRRARRDVEASGHREEIAHVA